MFEFGRLQRLEDGTLFYDGIKSHYFINKVSDSHYRLCIQTPLDDWKIKTKRYYGESENELILQIEAMEDEV